MSIYLAQSYIAEYFYLAEEAHMNIYLISLRQALGQDFMRTSVCFFTKYYRSLNFFLFTHAGLYEQPFFR